MKKLALFLFLSPVVWGQYVSDALKYSDIQSNGSTRFQTLGGNHAALGADLSNMSGNPAGLGFYNRSEMSIGLGLSNLSAKSNYITTSSTIAKSNSKIDNVALIFAKKNTNSKSKSTVWAFGYNKLADLNQSFSFQGTNKTSSMVDYYVERANRDQITPDEFDKNIDKFGTVGGDALGIADATLFYQGYLINPTTDNGAPYFRFDRNAAINQSGTYTSVGRVGQWSVSFSENIKNKFYYGVTAGFYSVNFNSKNKFTEQNSPATVFNGFELTELLNVKGSGFHLNIGGMYKLSDNLQLGANIITPTYFTVNESFTQSLEINDRFIPDANGKKIDPAFHTLNTEADVRNVDFKAPARANIGATFFLDNKKGFITASSEFTNFGKLKATVTDAYFDATQYNSEIVTDIKQTYGLSQTIRVGGEYKIGKWALRGGVSRKSDPYKNSTDGIDRKITNVGVGLGYRSGKSFYDFGISQFNNTKVYTPYVLEDPSNYASVKIQNSIAKGMITLGRFF